MPGERTGALGHLRGGVRGRAECDDEPVSTAARWSTSIDYVEEYATAANRFAAAVAGADMHARVPSCPAWSAYDLAVHLGNVHAWAATIVETASRAAEQNDAPRSARAKPVSRWYAGKAEDLCQVLRHARLDQPCWNFAFGTGVVGFWPRRQLHETTIHQVDLDLAARRPTDLAAELSADGIDEVLTVFLHRMHTRGHPADLVGPITLTATDTGDAWTVAPQPAGRPPTVEQVGTVGSGVRDHVAAPADVLYRLLWKRAPADDPALEVTGDRARVLAFLGSRLVP
jgi:uncharacterized protein (TIGR03083 family)